MKQRIQRLNGVKVVIVNSHTTKVKRTLLERLFSLTPFRAFKYYHDEYINDNEILKGDLNGETIICCNERTFKTLESKVKHDGELPK
jgi:hypothetical protein